MDEGDLVKHKRRETEDSTIDIDYNSGINLLSDYTPWSDWVLFVEKGGGIGFQRFGSYALNLGQLPLNTSILGILNFSDSKIFTYPFSGYLILQVILQYVNIHIRFPCAKPSLP